MEVLDITEVVQARQSTENLAKEEETVGRLMTGTALKTNIKRKRPEKGEKSFEDVISNTSCSGFSGTCGKINRK